MSFDLKLTGKDKIQVVINMIDDEYQGLVSGNTVTLYSGNIEAKGIKLKEQKQILDLLENDKKVIKYTAKKSFDSVADIPTQDQVDIYDIAPDIGRSTDEMFDEILEQLDYKIEVLDAFHEMTGKKVEYRRKTEQEIYRKQAELESRIRKTLNFFLDMTDNQQQVFEISTEDSEHNGLTFEQTKELIVKMQSEDYYTVLQIPDNDKGYFVVEFSKSHLKWLQEHDEIIKRQQNLELLPQYVLRVCKVYDAFIADKEKLNDDEHLNTLYVALVIKLDRLLEMPLFDEIRSKRPELHKSFLGRLGVISIEFNNDFRAKLWQFYDAANLLSAEFTADTGGLSPEDPSIQLFLEEVDSALKKHPNKPQTSSSPKSERLPTEQKLSLNSQSKSKVLFDTKISTLTFGKKECLIPDESLEHCVCKLVFKNRKIGAKETDVLDAAGFGQNSIRPVYNAHLRVNTKAKEHLGIEKLLVYKAAKIRLNKVNQ